MVVDEKLFEFLQEMLAQIIKSFYIGPAVCILFHGDDSIISNFTFFPNLLAFDHAYGPAGERTSRKCGLVHQDEYIDRIAIIGFSGRNKSKVIGERHSSGQNLVQFEEVLFGVKGKLVPAAFWSFDDDPQHTLVVGIERLQPGGISQSILRTVLPGHLVSLMTFSGCRTRTAGLLLG